MDKEDGSLSSSKAYYLTGHFHYRKTGGWTINEAFEVIAWMPLPPPYRQEKSDD